MKLVLAEKPSVAQSLAKVIGATKREEGYLEGGGYIVSWCVGHLVELAQPESYNSDYAKWVYDDLPILPEKLKYGVDTTTAVSVCEKVFNDRVISNLITNLLGNTEIPEDRIIGALGQKKESIDNLLEKYPTFFSMKVNQLI